MKTYLSVEDYLEVLSGKRQLDGKLPNNMFALWAGYNFAPIINLARYDTTFLDSVTDHTLQGGALTDRQAELALKLIFKYQRQLATKGIGVETMATPKYRLPLRHLDRSKRVWIEDDKMIMKFPYDAKMIQELRELLAMRQGAAHFDKEQKAWHVALTEFNTNFIVTWATGHKFDISTDLSDIMSDILAVEKQPYKIELCRVNGALTITNAETSLLEYLQSINVTLSDQDLIKLVDLGCELGYEVSDQVWQEVDDLVGADITAFMRKSDYEMAGDSGQISRLFTYAQLVNRLPMVVFDPSATGSEKIYMQTLGQDVVGLLGNRNTNQVDQTVVWTHRPLKDLDHIPLLVSHVGLMAGAEKSLMLQNSRKVIYYNHKL